MNSTVRLPPIRVNSFHGFLLSQPSRSLIRVLFLLISLVLPQAYQYLHRFGPGLILYWFGYAPCLQDDNDDVIIAAWDLPKYFMLPTGDFIGCGTVQLASYFEQDEEEE